MRKANHATCLRLSLTVVLVHFLSCDTVKSEQKVLAIVIQKWQFSESHNFNGFGLFVNSDFALESVEVPGRRSKDYSYDCFNFVFVRQRTVVMPKPSS